MKERLWFQLVTCLAYCIDKELYNAIDYLRKQYGSLAVPSAKVSKEPLCVFCGAVEVHRRLTTTNRPIVCDDRKIGKNQRRLSEVKMRTTIADVSLMSFTPR